MIGGSDYVYVKGWHHPRVCDVVLMSFGQGSQPHPAKMLDGCLFVQTLLVFWPLWFSPVLVYMVNKFPERIMSSAESAFRGSCLLELALAHSSR